MITEERKIMGTNNKFQNVILENRNKMTASGVLDVLTFDDQIILLETDMRIINCER